MSEFLKICFCLCLVGSTFGSELRNVTSEVFGNDLDVLPLAFGDFNSDKFTDIIVMNNVKSTVR